ncbi:MAG TPA: FAD-dependent monooxygenase [Ignavibacteria bacterium]|nr:FAD-dependent monooxygenase [Ignavibacteria bacterium]
MIQRIELTLSPEEASDDKKIEQIVREESRFKASDKIVIVKIKSSIDARSRFPFINLTVDVFINELPPPEPVLKENYKSTFNSSKKVLIIGAGPAGYFAALELIEHGIKPVIFDRGKNVRERRRDLRAIQQDSIVNPDSNYCFGEGGAGTYSDGKLYTRSHKRGDIYKALRIFVEHGAKSEILVEAHPHIGSNKLPLVIQNIRETILNFGGEINFNSKVTDFIIEKGIIKGVIINEQEEFYGDSVILATGHSARDIFYLLKKNKIKIESKPFALGIRIEHPQALIDEIQYKQKPRDKFLPAASYKLTAQVKGRGVFSFCMCPGGLIVPAATSPVEIVVNGMSMSGRDSEFANSGIVVAVEKEDLIEYEEYGELAGLEFQKEVERKFFDAGDGSQKAPAQRMTDYMKGRVSEIIGKTSYIPGVHSFMMSDLLPGFISERLKYALGHFGNKMKGYFTEEGYMIGVESRTSSPVRIPRNRETSEHIEIKNLYPCGEGAGYAGGIISAALDGQNVAKAIYKKTIN